MDKVKLLWSKTNRWHRMFLLFVVTEFQLVPGGKVGFLCNDPALSHQFTGDTISWKWLLTTVIFLPLAILLVIERTYNSDKQSDRAKQQALCWYKEYLFGVLINLTVIHILKQAIGSPRPHFFDTCSPKEAQTCERGQYVYSYTCTKAAWLSQSDRSFPSGHTSLALHAAVFIAYYLQQRTRHVKVPSILAVQILCLLAALCCSVSRITDRRHHWWDVLAGAVLSLPILFYTIYSLCGNFHCPRVTSEEVPNIDNTKNNLHHPVIDNAT
ncbi:putative phosphatidate phosphatase [Galleria mellonella]|uniref:Phosphatidate phosphatase n=1 Tax=Galleria mellonella TaxID=7137 RepID=A0A6J1X2A1_GALME|nr:putative phosphatidate phosphatase [Galleria mellonella]